MVGWPGLGKLWKGVVLSPITADAVDASGRSLLASLCSFPSAGLLACSSVRSRGVSEVPVGKRVFLRLAACSLAVDMFTLQLDGCAGRVLAAQLRC
ncbi:hypothetical protein Ancab_033187 [Ancistrocladus abbreviatus]